MDKRKLIAYLTVTGMLSIAAVALKFGVDVTLEDLPGVHMRMPEMVGDWQGEQLLYCHEPSCRWSGAKGDAPDGICPKCGSNLFSMAWVEREQLPADTEFLKYRYTRPSGESMLVSIVLSGRARNSIHRPQRCLVAQGFDITRSTRKTIPLKEREPLQVMQLDTLFHYRGPHRAHAQPVFYAYWFVGQDRATPSHLSRMFWLAWDRVFRGVAHRWVYIMVQAHNHTSESEFEKALEAFLPEWYPAVLR